MFPIIVHDESKYCQHAEERRVKIYCLAPLNNDFNETIDLYFAKPTRYGDEQRPAYWTLSKGSSGSHDLEWAELVAQGYALAIRIMKGEEGLTTSESTCQAFFNFMAAKREAEKVLRQQERDEQRERQLKAAIAKQTEEQREAEAQGHGQFVVFKNYKDLYQVRDIKRGNVNRRQFKTEAGAHKFADQCHKTISSPKEV